VNRTTAVWVLWAAGWAGVAAWSLVRPPALARLRPPAADSWPPWLPGFLKPRPDALPLRVRAVAGGAAGLAVLVALWDWGPLGWLAAGLAGPGVTLGLGLLERSRSHAAAALLRVQLPGALDAIAACLEAGLPLRRSVEVVAGLSPPEVGALLSRVVQGVAVGLTDAEAWLELGDHPVLGPIARDVARSADWGTTVGALLAEAAGQCRRDAESEAKTRARAVGVRTVLPLSLCYLPAFFLLGLVPMLASGVVTLLAR
jgi:hypothetical protein